MSVVPLALVCNPYQRGGVVRWMVDVAQEWARCHGDVFVVTLKPRVPFVASDGRPLTADLFDKVSIPRLRMYAQSVDRLYELGTEAYRAAVYAQAIRQAVPAGTTLILSNDPAAWRAGASVADSYPILGVLHSDEEHYYGLLKRYAAHLAGVVSVSSRIGVRAASLSAGLPSACVIPCGIRLDSLPPRISSDRVLRLLWVGRIEEGQKRVSDLPAIVSHVKSLGVECCLRVAGGGKDEELLMEQIRRWKVEDSVELLGWQSEETLKVLRAESDVLLLPSNFEGMPVVVMEALAAGCAVVASHVSGVEDYVSHEHAQWCYWTFKVGDVASAAEQVKQAAAVSSTERIEHAQAMAHDLFSIEACAQRYRYLVEKVCTVRRKPLALVPIAVGRLISGPLALARSLKMPVVI